MKMKIVTQTIFLSLVSVSFLACSATEDDFTNIQEACGEEDLETVRAQNDISDQCRDAIQAILPSPSNSLLNKIHLLGEEVSGGSRTIYFSGVNQVGDPLTTTNFEDTIVVLENDGNEVEVSGNELSFSSINDWATTSLSLSFVTDYSGSMRTSDLEEAGEIFTDIINVLPEIYTSQAIVFSEGVTTKLEFTTNKSALLEAFVVDEEYERASTALLDGMSQSVDGLVSEGRPLKLQFVVTDGLENSSQTATEENLLATMNENQIFTLMIGSLLSDPNQLGTLSGDNGAFVYAKTIIDTKNQVQTFLNSIQNAASVTFDNSGLSGYTIKSVSAGSYNSQ